MAEQALVFTDNYLLGQIKHRLERHGTDRKIETIISEKYYIFMYCNQYPSNKLNAT